MRKFPRPSHTAPLTDGCLSTGILLVLTALCPPIGVLFLIIYGVYKNHEESTNNILPIIIIGLLLILSPVLTILSFILDGFSETIKEYSPLVFITLLEVIAVFVILLKDKINFHLKPLGTGTYILIAIIFGILAILIIKKTFSDDSVIDPSSLLFFACFSAVLSLRSTVKLLENSNQQQNNSMNENIPPNNLNDFYEKYPCFKPRQYHSEEVQRQHDECKRNEEEKYNEASVELTVFITPNGKKYHKKDCKCIKSRPDLIEINLEAARKRGCSACNVCYTNH